MIAVIIIVLSLAASAIGATYLWWYMAAEKAAQVKEESRLRDKFRAALAHELQQRQASFDSFGDFAKRCGMDPGQAAIVARDFYARLCRRVLEDGVITDLERKSLTRLASVLNLDPATARSLEQQAAGDRYRTEVENVLADGVVSSDEEAALVSLRKTLGLASTQGLCLTEATTRDAYLATMRSIVRRGIVRPQQRDDLSRMRRALEISDGDAHRFLRGVAMELYRESYTMAVQDGVLDAEEKATLKWLESEAGLKPDQLERYHSELRLIERLQEYRTGNLPVIRTNKLLEGGEACHWEGPCRLNYETRKGTQTANGNLLITSQRVVFTSPEKAFSFSPSKVLDIELRPRALTLTLETRNGAGVYFVTDPRELEAILSGIVRKRKYLLSEGFSSSRTRHIPDNVKREVWDRDSGRCVRCGSCEYLEFDHIIPHGKGGSNSTANVQILCRRCNLEKSDRI